MLIRVALLFVLTLVPAPVHAQRAWDVTAVSGLFAGYTSRSPGTGFQESWFEGVQGGLIVGRYLTPHLKLELEGSTTNGTQFRERSIAVPGYPLPYPIGSEVTTSVRAVGATAVWQFRRNEWIHPFVQAGVTADFDRVSVRTWEQFFYGTRPPGVPPERIVEERIDGPTTVRSVRAVLAGGAKFYFSERGFVRTDGRWSLGSDRQNVAFRVGLGVDF
jgi:hypothetical protein